MSQKPNIRFKVELTHRNDPQPVFHRFTGSYSYSELSSVISHLWGQRPKHSILNYIDDEGDPIRVSTEEEWQECVRIHLSSTASVLRLSGKPGPKTKKSRGNKTTEESSSSSDSETETEKAPIAQQTTQATPPAADDLKDVSVVDETFEKTDTTSTAPIHLQELDNLQPVRAPSSSEEIAAVEKAEAVDTTPPTAEPPVEVKEETSVAEAEVKQTPQAEEPAVPQVNTGATAVDLMSLVYSCDAGEELFKGNIAKFSNVVTREVDPENPSEVHLDIDRSKLFRDTMFKSSDLMGKKKTLPQAEHLIKTAMVVFTDNVHLQYKLACILSLQKRLEECLDMLLVAQANGFDEISKIKTDSDLANVRKHPRFLEVLPCEDEAAAPIDYHEEVEEEKPAAVPEPKGPKPIQSDNPDVMALIAMFPDMSVDEATCVLVLAKGNLNRAVNARLQGHYAR